MKNPLANLEISKNCYMFVVLDTLKFYKDAKNIENKSGTKKKDRRTVASTAVFSRHRFEVSSSDLSPLFNQKLNVMLDTKRQSNAIGVRQSASCTQPSKSLIEAAQLLSRAKQIISSYGQQNKDMHDCIYPDVLEIQSSLSIASIHIGNIVGYEFQEKFFYNQERSFA